MASAGTAYVDVEAKLDSFAADIEAAVSSLSAQVDIEADTSAVEDAVFAIDGEQLSLFVDADATPAQEEIDAIDGTDVEVGVKVEGTEDAQEQIDNLAGSTGQLGEVARGAIGGMSGLGGAAGGAATALGSTAVGVGTLAVGVYEVAQAGIEAESAIQRFDFVTGNLGNSLSSIDVGGLSGDIGELALKIGSSDEAMLNATASFTQFAESSGASDDQIVEASDNINALALRAAAMNPALGDAGAVAERLAAALARGGRATRNFGIDVSTAEINARALSNTGKDNAADLTQFEKAAAGAQIAVERLGDSMGSDFQEGSENAALKWQRMTETFGELQEVAGGKMLPFVEDVTSAITKLNEGIQDFDLSDIASSLLDLSGPGMAINELFNFPEIFGWGDSAATAAGHVRELPPALRDTAGAADEADAALTDFSQSIDDYINGLFSVPGAQRDLRQSFSELTESLTTGTWDDQAVAIENVVTRHADLIAALQTQGASQSDLDAAVYGSIGALAQMRNQGDLTETKFQELSAAIEGVPHQSVTPVSTPGAVESRRQVDDLYAGLKVTGSARATPHVSVVTERVQFDRLIRDLDAADSRRFVMQVSVNAPAARAAGGPVTGGESYLVGEQGPEMFVPRSSGTIIPAPQTAAMAGGTYNVNVYASGNGDDIARAVADELRKLERAGR